MYCAGFICPAVRRRDKRDEPVRHKSAQNCDRRAVGRHFRQIRTDRAEEHTARQDHREAARRGVYSVSVLIFIFQNNIKSTSIRRYDINNLIWHCPILLMVGIRSFKNTVYYS